MTYPLPPEIATSYSAAEQALGDGSLPGQELDVDLAAVRASVTATIEFLKGITRSDGKLANGIVTKESLASSLVIGFDPPEIWASGVSYTTSSTVFQGYGFYLCTTAHVSSVFATDLASARWSLLADLTPPGGSLLASNNLSDVADAGNARANLGLGSMATASASAYRTNVEQDAAFQPILTGLTASVAELNHTDGVTSAIQTQLNGKQASDDTLTSLSGITLAAGDVLYATGADTLARLPKGTAGQGLIMNAAATAPEWASTYTWVAVATNGAAVYDFGSIPSWVSDIVCTFNAVSFTTKTDSNILQVGPSGTPVVAGYVGNTASIINAGASIVTENTNGFVVGSSQDTVSGSVRMLRRAGSNEWVVTGQARRSTSGPTPAMNYVSGHITLGAALDIVRLTRTGSGNYNGGVFAVGYR